MARRVGIPYQDMALKIVGPHAGYLAARIQRLDVPVNITSTDINELGNPNKAGSVEDVPEFTATFSAMDVGIKIFAALTGTDPTSYPAGGVENTELGEVDLIAFVKDADVADIVKCMHVRKAQVTDFTFSYSVDGESTEEYTVSGTEKRWFTNDVIVDTFDSAGGDSVTLSETPETLKSGDELLTLMLDGEYYDEVTGAPSSGEYSVSGTTVTLNATDVAGLSDKIVAVYQSQNSDDAWTNVDDDTMPAAVYGKDIPVTISANSVSRIQSLTIRCTFPSEMVKEMGNRSVVGTLVQTPEVTGDIEVLDTDTDLIALFTSGELEPAGVTEFRACELTASGISLTVEIQDPGTDRCGDTGTATTLKTVYIPEIKITSEGHTSNVGENVTQTFGFKSTDGSLTVYSGSI